MEANIDGQRKAAYNTGFASWNPAHTEWVANFQPSWTELKQIIELEKLKIY